MFKKKLYEQDVFDILCNVYEQVSNILIFYEMFMNKFMIFLIYLRFCEMFLLFVQCHINKSNSVKTHKMLYYEHVFDIRIF